MRRQGQGPDDCGAQAAASLFGQFPGRWTVRQRLTNPAATAFWRKAIRYPFQEHEQGTEIVQSFGAGRLVLRAAWGSRSGVPRARWLAGLNHNNDAGPEVAAQMGVFCAAAGLGRGLSACSVLGVRPSCGVRAAS